MQTCNNIATEVSATESNIMKGVSLRKRALQVYDGNLALT